MTKFMYCLGALSFLTLCFLVSRSYGDERIIQKHMPFYDNVDTTLSDAGARELCIRGNLYLMSPNGNIIQMFKNYKFNINQVTLTAIECVNQEHVK